MELCSADERIVAAFLGGSHARAEADEYSDLDLCLITTDEAYEDVLSERETIIERLGEPLFLEDFGLEGTVFFILAEGTEAELFFGRTGGLHEIHDVGPYRTLLDTEGSSRTQNFPGANPIGTNRSKRSAVSFLGSGTSYRTSSQRSDAGNSGGPTANSRPCVVSA